MSHKSLPSFLEGIDPSKLKLPGINFDERALNSTGRDNTFALPPPPLSWFPSMSFETYNKRYVEPWMAENYENQPPPPFLDSYSDLDFAPFLDQYLCSAAEQLRSMALNLSYAVRTSDVASGPVGRSRMERWLKMEEKEREAILLQLWETYQRACESINVYEERFDCPELTLKNLAANGGKGMMKLLLDCITVPIDLPEDEYPLVPNDHWDRLFLVGKYEPRVPLTRAKRVFVQLSLGLRHRGLFIFCYRWMLLMDGRPDMQLGIPAAQDIQLNAQTAPNLAATSSKSRFSEMQERQKSFGPDIQMCASCGAREGGAKKVHLLCCSRCRSGPDGGRSVFYCSSECQKRHFRIHKAVCGTPIGSDPAVSKIPSYEAARDHSKHLPADSFLRNPIYTGTSLSYHPDGKIMFATVHSRGGEPEMDPEKLWAMCAEADYEKGGIKTLPVDDEFRGHEKDLLEREEDQRKQAASVKHEITPEELAAKLAKTKLKGMFGSKKA